MKDIFFQCTLDCHPRLARGFGSASARLMTHMTVFLYVSNEFGFQNV